MLGYHGTSNSNALEIFRDGFLLGDGWLGPGIYFFIEKISISPANDAEYWARFIAKKRNWKEWAVLQAEIDVERILDLTDEANIRVFNEIRDYVYENFEITSVKSKQKVELDPGIILMMCANTTIGGVMSHAVFRFNREIDKNIRSVIPSSTMICVFNQSEVDQAKIQILKKGTI